MEYRWKSISGQLIDFILVIKYITHMLIYMRRQKSNQLGFGHLFAFLLVLLVISIAGVAYWRISNTNQDSTTDTNSTSKVEPKSFSFNAVGDFSSNSNADLVLTSIGNSETDFTLALGDLGYAGNGTETTWCEFVKARVGTEYPFELVAGNHDDGTADGNILEYRECLPDKLIVNGDYGIEYYFDYEDLARIIMISPDINNYGFAYTSNSEHYDWLKTTINEATSPWVIVGMHKNCITPGTKTCEIGADLLNLLVEEKVDLILQGHEHGYMRSKQLALAQGCVSIVINEANPSCVADSGDDFKKAAGSLLLISGAGGQALREIDLNDPEIGYFDTWNGSNVGNTYGFTKITIQRNKLTSKFISANGPFSDEFVITR